MNTIETKKQASLNGKRDIKTPGVADSLNNIMPTKQKKTKTLTKISDIKLNPPVSIPLEVVSDNEAELINSMHHELQVMGLNMLGRMIAIGEKLAAKKTQLGHGKWEPWVTANLKFTSRTARRYMDAYKHRDDPKLKDSPDEFMLRLYGNTPAIEVESQAVETTSDSDSKRTLTSDSDKPQVPSEEGRQLRDKVIKDIEDYIYDSPDTDEQKKSFLASVARNLKGLSKEAI
jgi:hypothetical protein